jgi:hypothetical protein
MQNSSPDYRFGVEQDPLRRPVATNQIQPVPAVDAIFS